jgi:3-phenylpropionate/cinnamic acid dioxygenase small subunit
VSAPDLDDDRQAITRLIHRYAWCIDRKEWDGWGALFTDDATAEYLMWGDTEPMGGRRERAGLVPWMRDSMAIWPVTHHLLGNVEITLDGDDARSNHYFQATHVTPGDPVPFQAGGWYDLEHRRTAAGWGIHRLRLEIVWMTGGQPNVANN